MFQAVEAATFATTTQKITTTLKMTSNSESESGNSHDTKSDSDTSEAKIIASLPEAPDFGSSDSDADDPIPDPETIPGSDDYGGNDDYYDEENSEKTKESSSATQNFLQFFTFIFPVLIIY